MDAKIVKSDPLQKPEIIATEPTKQESQDLKVIEPEFSDLEGEPSFIETDPKGTLSEFTDNQEGMVTEPTTTTEQPTPQSIIVENLSFADELALSPLADSESLLVQPDVLKEDANELVHDNRSDDKCVAQHRDVPSNWFFRGRYLIHA
jgi:hypothetical protein